MSGPVWRIEDPEPQPTPPGVVQGSWVSLHYLRSELRRRWRLVAATATAGLLLALVAMFALPQSATASATVLLQHDPASDPLTAIQTDESLLATRTVSENAVDALGLPMSPDAFQGTFTASQASTEVLVIDLKAPTNAEAVRRLTALCAAFLDFRNGTLQERADKIVASDKSQMEILQNQVDGLTQESQAALSEGQGELAQSYIGQIAQRQDQIATLQQESQTTALTADSLAAASHVVDPAAPLPPGGKKRIALGVMSGLILGGGLGIGLVFVHALISNSLRRREDVATALGRPVSFSTGAVSGVVPWRRRNRARNLEVLATGLISGLPDERSGTERLGVLGVGDLRSAARVVVAAARELESEGDQVFLVDLTEQGWLARRHGDLAVYRPEERAHLTDGPLALASSADTGVPREHPLRADWQAADVVLVLGEVELGVGTGHLSTWADRAVVVVGAGKATAELLRSISRMLTRNGPKLEFGMLVGADATDESLGVPRRVAADEQQLRVRG